MLSVSFNHIILRLNKKKIHTINLSSQFYYENIIIHIIIIYFLVVLHHNLINESFSFCILSIIQYQNMLSIDFRVLKIQINLSYLFQARIEIL